MRFDDPRTEWRINDVEKTARKALRIANQNEATSGDVRRLEHSLREISSALDELRSNYNRLQEENNEMKSALAMMIEEGEKP